MAIDLTSIKNDKKYLFVIVGLLLAGLFFSFSFLVFASRVKKLRALGAQLKEKEADILNSRNVLRQRGELEDELRKIETELAGYKKRLSKDVEFPAMLRELTVIAQDLEVEFLSIQPLPRIDLNLGEGERTFSLSEIPIRLKLRGGYNELLRFIGRVEQAAKFIKVDNFGITSDSKEIWRHSAEIVVSSFVLK